MKSTPERRRSGQLTKEQFLECPFVTQEEADQLFYNREWKSTSDLIHYSSISDRAKVWFAIEHLTSGTYLAWFRELAYIVAKHGKADLLDPYRNPHFFHRALHNSGILSYREQLRKLVLCD